MDKNLLFHGSYKPDDVTFLLKKIDIKETNILDKENLIQSGQKHYSEMISQEYAPSKEYIDLFYQAFYKNSKKLAEHVLELAKEMSLKDNVIIVSLARAGTPIGVLLKRTLKEVFKKDVCHYSISIIRDKGIDENALKYIIEKNQNTDKDIIFVDGWTGKGVISAELKKSVNSFNKKYNTKISSDLWVLADISGKAFYSATSEDYLIPSSVLNSTISGLVSRSILNNDFINENDFHGCKYYPELLPNDLSLWFIDEMMKIINNIDYNFIHLSEKEDKNYLEKISDQFISEYIEKYKVKSINYIKPGIGETTRVLLRRVPDKILVKNINLDEVKHLLVLAHEKNVLIEEINDMPYKAVGIISDLKGD